MANSIARPGTKVIDQDLGVYPTYNWADGVAFPEDKLDHILIIQEGKELPNPIPSGSLYRMIMLQNNRTSPAGLELTAAAGATVEGLNYIIAKGTVTVYVMQESPPKYLIIGGS